MPTSKLNKTLLLFSGAVIFLLVLYGALRNDAKDVSIANAQKLLREHLVKEVVVSDDYVYLKTKEGVYKIPTALTSPKMFFDYKVRVDSGSQVVALIVTLLFIVAVASIIFRYWQKRQEKRPIRRTFEQKIDRLGEISDHEGGVEAIQATRSDVTFADIGGIEEVKEELQEIIDFMKNPKKYKDFGARLPRGVLLVGPPGVGKTMIAKAVANAAGVSFYYQSGASFVQIYVGMGAKRVHELFAAAKKNAPAIIFIDEIDAVGKKRDGNRNDEREATLNQLLTEMDGFESQSGVIVLAATNKIDVLDPALLRAGRFDRRVFVDLPTKTERASILKKYLQKIPNSVDVDKIAAITVGFNGATLAAFVNEAALLALRNGQNSVTFEHFLAVKDKVMFGKKKLVVLNEKQKKHRITYQTGKVLVATYFDIPFEKLLLSNERLTPPIQEDTLLKSEIEARMKTLLAGIALCDMKYGEHASSAKEDLDEVRSMAHAMATRYAMARRIVEDEQAANEIVQRLYEETKTLLTSFESVVSAVEEKLLEQEAITKQEVKALIDAVL